MRITVQKEQIPWAMAAGRALLGPVLIVGERCNWSGLGLATLVVTALFSDIFDGVLARRWRCDTAGVRLFDSMADTVFYGCVAIALWIGLPHLLRANAGLLAAVLGLEAANFGVAIAKFGKPASYHSYLAKTWGLVMATGVIAAFATGRSNPLIPIALGVGVVSNLEGMAMSLLLPVWRKDVKTLRAAWEVRREVQGSRLSVSGRRGRTVIAGKENVPAASLLAIAVCVLLVGAECGVAQTAKVGTFDTTSIVVAFYDSPMWSAELKANEAEMQQAKAAGDQKKVAELSKWGKGQQKLAHKQMAGGTDIDNILQTMKPTFAAVAAQTHVATIVPKAPRATKNVTTVDVTNLLMDQLQADAGTRQTAEYLRDLKKAHPMKYRLYMFLFRFEGD